MPSINYFPECDGIHNIYYVRAYVCTYICTFPVRHEQRYLPQTTFMASWYPSIMLGTGIHRYSKGTHIVRNWYSLYSLCLQKFKNFLKHMLQLKLDGIYKGFHAVTTSLPHYCRCMMNLTSQVGHRKSCTIMTIIYTAMINTRFETEQDLHIAVWTPCREYIT